MCLRCVSVGGFSREGSRLPGSKLRNVLLKSRPASIWPFIRVGLKRRGPTIGRGSNSLMIDCSVNQVDAYSLSASLQQPWFVLVAVAIGLLSLTGCVAVAPIQASDRGDTAGLAAADAGSAARTPATRQLTVAEKAILADAFAASLREPDDVKFRWTKIRVINGADRRLIDYCAQLNLKDANGKYKGLQPFLATIVIENEVIISGAIVALDAERREENLGVIPGLCRQKGLSLVD